MTDLKEHLAAYAHQAWSGWMEHLFLHGTFHPDGTFTIEAEKVARWKRQMRTAYADLSDEEKVSDRNEADAILEIISRCQGGEWERVESIPASVRGCMEVFAVARNNKRPWH